MAKYFVECMAWSDLSLDIMYAQLTCALLCKRYQFV